MMWFKLTKLALAAMVGVMSPLAAQASRTAADSAVETLLSAEQLTHYIAVKKVLGPYWQAHAELLQTAQATGHAPVIQAGMQQLEIGVFDYPNLVKQDAALAAIFTKNEFAASQFEPTQVAVFKALLALVSHEATGAALPAASTMLGKNVVLVKAHREELEAVGVALQTSGGKGSVDDGSNDDGSNLKP